jgi:hypothetical protein
LLTVPYALDDLLLNVRDGTVMPAVSVSLAGLMPAKRPKLDVNGQPIDYDDDTAVR